MLSKPSAAALPLVALAIDWGWLRRSGWRIALALLPWFAMALWIAWVSRELQVAVTGEFRVPFWQRPLFALDEAVERIRLDASARGRADIALAPARHLTTEAAKVALPKARRALLEALVAWGLIPQRETPPARQRVTGTDADEREPRRRTPTQAGKRAFESWDPEAMS